jgi:hypothetical protein
MHVIAKKSASAGVNHVFSNFTQKTVPGMGGELRVDC